MVGRTSRPALSSVGHCAEAWGRDAPRLCRACSTVLLDDPAAVHDEHAFGKRLAEVDVVG